MIAIVHPGQMGASVGSALVAGGHQVGWASSGRGPDTRRRAAAAGLQDLGTIDAIREQCEIVISICPPHAAIHTAEQFRGYRGVYVEANAVSPRTVASIGELIRAGGGRMVDAAVIGLPPRTVGDARLYLSGPDAGWVAEFFRGGLFTAVALDDPESASALKMTYAAWTKISTALLLATVDVAGRLGVAAALEREWNISQPGLQHRPRQARAAAAEKGWRWVGEMHEIATTFDDAEVTPDFAAAAAEIYRHYPHEQPEGD